MRGPLRMLARRRGHLAPAPGDVAVDIDRLISPLRYDVLVRERHFRFLHRNFDLYHRDFEAFVALARAEPYYAWFRTVAIHRIRAGTKRRAELEVAFRERLRKTTRLSLAFADRGFDPEFPVILRTAGPVAVTRTGKSVVGRLFPSDGCHRLALLRLSGYRQLPPEWYRIRSERGWHPPDNTGTLITALGLTMTEYFEFLSLGYTPAVHASRDALLSHVAVPADADELRRIIDVDTPGLEAAARR